MSYPLNLPASSSFCQKCLSRSSTPRSFLFPKTPGCLSVPKLYADVVRSRRIVLKSMLLDGSSILLECGGLLARCVQHELDHLDGVVFVQRAEEESYQAIEPGLRKLLRKGGYRNFTVRRLI